VPFVVTCNGGGGKFLWFGVASRISILRGRGGPYRRLWHAAKYLAMLVVVFRRLLTFVEGRELLH